KLSFGSGGNGTPAHLAGELLKLEAKIDITHVPFRGTGPALQAVIGGHVPMAFNPPSPLLPHIQSGTIRPLAVTTLKRTQVLPRSPPLPSRAFPASRRRPGMHSWRRRGRRRTSSPRCIARPLRPSTIRRCAKL